MSNEILDGKYTDVIKVNCGVCNKKIIVRDTALHLCNNCFDEKCECGHIRATHIDNTGSCVHTYSLRHKTKRGEYCPCPKFILKEKKQ